MNANGNGTTTSSFHSVAAAAAGASSETPSLKQEDLLKNPSNPSNSYPGTSANENGNGNGSAYSANSPKDSLLQHMAASLMASSNPPSGNTGSTSLKMPSEMPTNFLHTTNQVLDNAMDLFERHGSLDPTSAVVAQAANASMVPSSAVSSLNAAAGASALSASSMLNAFAPKEDLFEPVPLNNIALAAAAAGVPGSKQHQLSSNLMGWNTANTTNMAAAAAATTSAQSDGALARLLSSALDQVTADFESDPLLELNSINNPSTSQLQQQQQQQHHQLQLQLQPQQMQPLQMYNQAQNQMFPQGVGFMQQHNKRSFGTSMMMMMENMPNKRARIAADANASVLEEDDAKSPRFRPYQEKQWLEQFDELLKFKEEHSHCLVPHTFDENPTLSRWVKRQRYQYKLKQEKKQSTMTDARIQKLEAVGFIWDSHGAAWEERRNELAQYKLEHGDCNVPSNYAKNPQLATWVKCQRRQCKLFWNGKPSNMTLDRFASLNQLGFTWELRNGSSSSKKVRPIVPSHVPH